MEAARVFTCGGVDAGHRPSVLSAVSKYHQTELMRALSQDAMDVMGGAAICLGPRNLIARAHIGAPIGITVEGANILTRTLILFGQGAIRCHPWVQKEMRALEAGDETGLRRALLGHAGFFLKNLVRSRLPGRSPVAGPTAVHYRRLSRASARFALLTDLALLSLGSRLKFKEKLSGRFADVLSWMYLGFCALRRFEAEGRREEDLPLVRWAAEHALSRIQTAFEGIRQNFPGPLRFLIPRGRIGSPPSDRLGAEVAALLRQPGEQRDRLTAGLFLPADPHEALARLERAFVLTCEDAPEAASAREDALRVDSFPPEGDSRPLQSAPASVFASVDSL
jgi:acyl-CoA dehydrogenase